MICKPTKALVLVCIALSAPTARAQDDPAVQMRKILARARTREPLAAEELYEQALSYGDEGRSALLRVLEYRAKRLARSAEHLLQPTALSRSLEFLGKELEIRRKAALAMIFDSSIYPDEDHGRIGQPRVDEAVGGVRALFENSTAALRERDAGIEKIFANLEVLEDWFERCDAPFPEPEVLPGTLAARLDSALDLESVGLSRSVLRWNRETRLANRDALTSIDEQEREVIDLTNRYRWMMGLRILEIDERICRAARGHSLEMLELGYFAHSSPVAAHDSPSKRGALEGYSAGLAENIATARDGRGAFLAWYHSSGHHRNMLGRRHQQIGVGRAGEAGRMLFTQCFGRGDSLRGRRAFSDPRLAALARLRSIADREEKRFLAAERLAVARQLTGAGFPSEARLEAAIVALVQPDNEGAGRLLAPIEPSQRQSLLERARDLRERRLARRAIRAQDPQPCRSPFLELRSPGDPMGAANHTSGEGVAALARSFARLTRQRKKALLQRAASGEWEDPSELWRVAMKEREASLREFLCTCLYDLGGEREIALLGALVRDGDFRVRHAASQLLFLLGEERSVQVLVRGLGARAREERADAITRLREAVGKDFGFHPDDPPELRHKAEERWRAWLSR